MADFYAILSRMKNIQRWSLMRSNIKENVMEHSALVAIISHALGEINNRVYNGNVNVDKLVTIAIFHESSEVLTGDLPTPIKYYNQSINSAYKAIEAEANTKLISCLPSEFRQDYEKILNYDKDTYEYKLVKSADKISAYIKCVEEVKSGNSEFNHAKDTLYKTITTTGIAEVDYFNEHFLTGFEKNLDNITL